MPARKRGLQGKYRKPVNHVSIKNKLVKLLLFTLIIFGIIFAAKLLFKAHFWNGKDKLNIAIQEKSGDVKVAVFDPGTQEVVIIGIPGDTQVEVAMGLGIWKLKSVWELGKEEGRSGELLVKTISKSFNFPVYIWADSQASGFLSNNPLTLFKSVITPYKTNLSIGDKLAVAIFSLKLKNVNRELIDLSKTTFLKIKDLEDGLKGYVVTGLPSPKLYANFTEDNKGQPLRVLIIDGTEKPEVAKEVGGLIEVTGMKVSSINKVKDADFTCIVFAKNKDTARKISLLFGCRVGTEKPEDNFDAEIKLGKEFVKIF